MFKLKDWIFHPLRTYKVNKYDKIVRRKIKERGVKIRNGALSAFEEEGSVFNWGKYSDFHILVYTANTKIPKTSTEAEELMGAALLNLSELEFEIYKKELYIEKLRRVKASLVTEEERKRSIDNRLERIKSYNSFMKNPPI